MASVNAKSADIARTLKLEKRMESYTTPNAYLTFKDHKENFPHKIACRLINPAKSDIGRVSKQLLQMITEETRASTNVQQWRSTGVVIDWFNGLANKSSLKFFKFDIVSFYPSITRKLLEKSLAFASQCCRISESDKNIILHACESFLFKDGAPWTKKSTQNNFDVTMGSYDGAEVCELVGLFLLNKLTNNSRLFGISEVGLYRDDGLAVFQGSGPQADSTRKKIESLFKEESLQITVEANMTATDYLDVFFNLGNGSHRPYRKPNDSPSYIHTQSNHPPTIINQLPKMIEKRLSTLSSSREIFDENKGPYQAALVKSGYKEILNYVAPPEQPQKRKRTRNILWFNPPFNRNVKTNVGKKFLRLIDKHFPAGSELHKYFNRATIKVSYSTTKNMKTMIDKHNKYVLGPSKEKSNGVSGCNCRKKQECPIPDNCLQKSVVYKAVVKGGPTDMIYYGLTEDTFKTRWNAHKSSFKHEKQKSKTKLSNYVWKLKGENKPHEVEWSIKARAFPYKSGSKHCDLCLVEKTTIALADQKFALNSRSEIMSKCRHKNKYCLNKF